MPIPIPIPTYTVIPILIQIPAPLPLPIPILISILTRITSPVLPPVPLAFPFQSPPCLPDGHGRPSLPPLLTRQVPGSLKQALGRGVLPQCPLLHQPLPILQHPHLKWGESEPEGAPNPQGHPSNLQ